MMADRMSPESRSRVMSSIRNGDTTPELAVRRFLFARGFRYRLRVRGMPGTPDIVLPRYRTVIFVNGCFWHGHFPCVRNRPPKSNLAYWLPKLRENKERDRRKSRQLRSLGWNVITIWECEVGDPVSLAARLSRLVFERRVG